MLFETLATFYSVVHNENELTIRNNQVGYALQLSKSTLVIAQACWELPTPWAIKCSSLNCTEILKNFITRSPGNKIWGQIFKNMRNKVCSVASTNLNTYFEEILKNKLNRCYS